MPINPYGRTKLIIEKMLGNFANVDDCADLPAYFNASGAELGRDIGESRDPKTHLIPRAMLALLGGVKELAIFGSDDGPLKRSNILDRWLDWISPTILYP